MTRQGASPCRSSANTFDRFVERSGGQRVSRTDFVWDEGEPSRKFVHPDLSPGMTVLLGVLTIWPIAYFLLVIGSVVFVSVGALGTWDIVRGILGVGTMLLSYAMTAYYGIYVYRDTRFAGDKQVIWLLVILLGGIIGQMVFYFLWFVKHDQSLVATSTPAPTETVVVPPSDA